MTRTGSRVRRGAAAAAAVLAFAGPAAAQSVVTTAGIVSNTAPIAPSLAAIVWVGTPVPVTVTNGQRVTGVVSTSLGLSTGGPVSLRYGMCRQAPAGGAMTYVGNDYTLVDVTTSRTGVTMAATDATVPAGTWNVGACAVNLGTASVDRTWDTIGWVQVTN